LTVILPLSSEISTWPLLIWLQRARQLLVLGALRFQQPFLLELGGGRGELAELRLQDSGLRLQVGDLLLQSGRLLLLS